MLEDVKHIIADLKEKQINNEFQISEIEKMNLSKLAELPREVEKLGLKLGTIQANINGNFTFGLFYGNRGKILWTWVNTLFSDIIAMNPSEKKDDL